MIIFINIYNLFYFHFSMIILYNRNEVLDSCYIIIDNKYFDIDFINEYKE